jgi:16S rRNA C1402 N4-methylase RsmH
MADAEEVAANPRARSARLRIAERIEEMEEHGS